MKRPSTTDHVGRLRSPKRARLVLAVLAAAATAVVTGCTTSGGAAGGGVPALRYQGWNDQVTLPELADALGYFDGKVKLDWVGNTTSGPQDIQSAATGQTDFGGAFGGAVEKLVSSGAPIKAVINYYGGDAKSFTGYYVLKGSPLTSAKQLIGKKVGVNTLGGQNEADIFNQLRTAGLSAGQIKKVELVPLPPPNIENALRHHQIDVASLSGQFQQLALAHGGIRPLFTQLDEYGPFNGGQYVFRTDFLEKHPDAVRAFTAGVARAIEWETTTPRKKVLAEFTKIINARKRSNEDTTSIKYWLSSGIPAQHGVIADKDFAHWKSWLLATGSVQTVPASSKLYTNEFNPYAKTGK
ncbi:MAG TPA: ABC transporter substrate-binding protein [Flexivirga sp.]|uniref:ABC transporter substrate-binding protein n=1 Tax=Flexivirga sp. TaxID=1962927 RepID=UPI002BCD3201|nr:ABC transporter substrate-binding protein [Flexivirga sp.]HWC24254.1 ABC transporter substrate-binding protein [Flexivirga sp.]